MPRTAYMLHLSFSMPRFPSLLLCRSQTVAQSLSAYSAEAVYTQVSVIGLSSVASGTVAIQFSFHRILQAEGRYELIKVEMTTH